ncbi:ribosomal protein L8 (nucleomorph) [Bigelowiella natans]|uniref:Ribosomal protein L8 n=1 Tax=Bigelowiella natans TaxID=227086 RepID=Q3LWH0_BIGNA|nr:ribosomal protein L8 [Bigelowiella natans]ABA27196.1 ribosomal protein L8 [Bigelowiella natans]
MQFVFCIASTYLDKLYLTKQSLYMYCMGKIISAQRKGKIGFQKQGSSRRIGKISYKSMTNEEKYSVIKGIISKFHIDTVKKVPAIKIKFNVTKYFKNYYELYIAVEKLYLNKTIACGLQARPITGNVLPLFNIPNGVFVCNVEEKEGDGGKLARSAGAFVGVLSHSKYNNVTKLKLPSKKIKILSSFCRATIGVVAGGGKYEKPLLKAGKNYYKFKSLNKKYPIVKIFYLGKENHPHGGGNHQHIGHPSTVSRRSPPGQKVGLIAARRSGRKKSRKVYMTQ